MTTDSSKEKILIVISKNEFIRNYVTTGAFTEIEKFYECKYLLSEAVSLSHDIDKDKLEIYKVIPNNQRIHINIFNILMWKYQKVSSSFKFRVMRLMHLDLTFPARDNGFIKLIKVPVRLYRWILQCAFFFLLANKVTSAIALSYYRSRLIENDSLTSVLTRSKFCLVIFPSSAYDPDGNDLLRVCKNMGIPSLFLIDNWDNLSSKSIMWLKPTMIGVWGEQSRQHAVNIQDFMPWQVKCIGTPRFDQYFKLRDQKLSKHFSFTYILFVGTALSFDEVGVLVRLNAIINENLGLFDNLKIVYRPHPWRQGYDKFFSGDLEHVVIDPQVDSIYSSQSFSADNQPELSYYPSLIKNAEFVIGGLTSMLIEALIFNKRFLAMVHDDGKNLTSQHNAYKYFMHFRGLEKIDEIKFCSELCDLENCFVETWNKRDFVDKRSLDMARQFFYYADDLKYSERLLELCDMAIDNSHKRGI